MESYGIFKVNQKEVVRTNTWDLKLERCKLEIATHRWHSVHAHCNHLSRITMEIAQRLLLPLSRSDAFLSSYILPRNCVDKC